MELVEECVKDSTETAMHQSAAEGAVGILIPVTVSVAYTCVYLSSGNFTQ